MAPEMLLYKIQASPLDPYLGAASLFFNSFTLQMFNVVHKKAQLVQQNNLQYFNFFRHSVILKNISSRRFETRLVTSK